MLSPYFCLAEINISKQLHKANNLQMYKAVSKPFITVVSTSAATLPRSPTETF
jgi:hypothetical protein